MVGLPGVAAGDTLSFKTYPVIVPNQSMSVDDYYGNPRWLTPRIKGQVFHG